MVTSNEPASASASHSGAAGRRARHSTIDSTNVITDSDAIAFVWRASSWKRRKRRFNDIYGGTYFLDFFCSYLNKRTKLQFFLLTLKFIVQM